MTHHQLTETQKGIFFDCQLGHSSQYHISAGFRMVDLDVGLFERAIQKIIDEHEALRCSVALADDLPVLAVHETVDFHLDSDDLRGEAHAAAIVDGALDKITLDPFDLTAAPLFRARLLRVSDSEYVFLICAHHIVTDGWSLSILQNGILGYYEALRNGVDDPVERHDNFLKFIAREHARLASGRYQPQKEYWLQKLKGAPPLQMPTDFARVADGSSKGREQRADIDAELYGRLQDLCRTHEVSVFMALVAAFAVFLHKYTGNRDVVFAAPITNRPDLDFEQAVGCFVSMFPVRCAVADEHDLSRVLRDAKTTLIEVYNNSSYSSNLIARDSRLGPYFDSESIFDISISYDIYEEAETESSVRMEMLEHPTITFPGSLMFVIVKSGDSIQLKVQYNSALFSDRTIALMCRRFIGLLETFLADPHKSVGDVSLLEVHEGRAIRDEFTISQVPPDEPGIPHTTGSVAAESGSLQITPSELEHTISRIWMDVLRRDHIGESDNFFDIGGHSSALIQVFNKLTRAIGRDLSIVSLFQYPTIRRLARHLAGPAQVTTPDRSELFTKRSTPVVSDVAIIGMSIKVPGANSVAEFWGNLLAGKESIRFYDDHELLESGVTAATLRDPNYVKARGALDGIECFDAAFFEYAPWEADRMSPQLRALSQAVWEALEDAAYDPDSYPGRIGLFVGGSEEFEWYKRALLSEERFSDVFQTFTLNTNHFLATRIAHKLNLKGPAYSTVSGCSTTLVTPHLACQALALHECDMAIAGGVTIELPNSGGYFYEEGMMFSPDGHCRPFSAEAKGTIFSNGLGIVVLKRLDDALRDGDHISAVIRGSAVNNDGRDKIGYTAPSVDGQTDVITAAYQKAGIDPETVSYVEAHGTGTSLGDPIEIEALTRAFRTSKKQFCRIGSVKGNVGHTDTAAGVVGLIKVALCLKHRVLPASINCSPLNPQINFEESPFVVNLATCEWQGDVLRAGINSFGIGGTNAHLVLEEAPPTGDSGPERAQELLVFSARTKRSVEAGARRVVAYLEAHPEVKLSDAAYTLQVGRQAFDYRQAVVVDRARLRAGGGVAQLAEAMSGQAGAARPVYFLFPGQGTQYQGMGRGLYDEVRRYREEVDAALAWLPAADRAAIWAVLYGAGAPEAINETQHSQVALFVVEYALARYVMGLGIRPQGLVGHSLGELVAATIAGVFELGDAVRLVWRRGQIMQAQPRGAMLAVAASEAAVRPTLIEGVAVAVVNTTQGCVVSGETARVEVYAEQLRAQGVECRRVATSHAFHSPLMAAAAAAFTAAVAQVRRGPVGIPFISNVSGTWIGAEAGTARYWGDQLRQPVQFAQGLAAVLQTRDALLLEVGPGQSLSTFAQQHRDRQPTHRFVYLLRHPKEPRADAPYLADKLGRVWCEGVALDWAAYHDAQPRHRVPLPTYDFEKQVFALETPVNAGVRRSSPALDDSSLSGVTLRSRGDDLSGLLEPQTDVEAKIIRAYQSVLGFDRIGMTESFFDLGGDSLKAVSLASALRDFLQFKVDLTDLFENPTPQQLAQHLSAGARLEPAVRRITPAPAQDFYPLSSAQRRMYSLYLLDPANLAYNLPSVTIIEGDLDRRRIDHALKRLIARHETLRTSFHVHDGQPVQKIHDAVEIPIRYRKQRAGTSGEIARLVHGFVAPFDLSQAPLFRVELIEVGPRRHLLLFDVHHIAADGTSVELLTRDVSQLYVGELDALPIQYKDFAVWQNDHLASDGIKEHKAFWLGLFADGVPVIDLPLDRVRPAVKSFEGDHVRFSIDADLCSAVRSLSQVCGTTVFMTLLAALFVLLKKYSGQSDLVVGTPSAGRTRAGLQHVAGMFVNTLAMRNVAADDVFFSDFLDQVKQNSLRAFEHQEYQFDALVDDLKPDRDLSRSPLFDVLFDFQNMEFFDFEIEGIKFTPHRCETKTSAFDLVLSCQQDKGSDCIDGVLTFCTRIFARDSIERMQRHYLAILRQVTRHPQMALAEIDVLSDDERDLLVRRFNDTDLAYDRDATLPGLFEAIAARCPDKVALITADGEYTYRELNERANRLAHTLRSMGARPDTLVGVLLERNVHLFVGLLAVLKAGAGYVPLDPQFPRDRLHYMVRQSELLTLLTQRTLVPDWSDASAGIVDVEDEANYAGVAANPEPVNTAADICCVIYTSGSTGVPKGVSIPHRAFVNFGRDLEARRLFDEDTRVFALTTVSFDIFAFESIVPLCTGHSVYLANEQEQLDPHLANLAILRHRVTHMNTTVSRLTAFVDSGAFAPSLKQLRHISAGGETYTSQLLESMQRQSTAKIFNMYGPTETTVWSMTKDLTATQAITIGRPISNTRTYIVGKDLRIQPVGVFGELCIGGDGLARGYWKDEQLTAARFGTLKDDGDRVVYRTGDVARWLPSGEIELKGRLDAQVKIRGYRIEPAEIERAALTLDGIKEAVVIAFDDPQRNKYLNLYYCEAAERAGQVGSQLLRDHLLRALPAYMMPAHIVRLDAMPYLPNGKLNRNGFAKTVEAEAGASRSHVAPSRDLEKSVAAIWRDVLGLEQVGIRDSFFDLGGNSFGLILVSNKLSDLTGRHVPLIELFRHPTIESLVGYFEQGGTAFARRKMWRAPQLHSDIAIVGMAGRFPGAIDVDEYWKMLRAGTEGISSLRDDDLLESGVAPELVRQPNYVKAKGVVAGTEFFDADFFGYSPREADSMDPQIRLLHQCAWEALERAGYDSSSYDGAIGLFAGSASNLMWMTRFIAQQSDTVRAFETVSLNEKDFLTTRISYKLGLKGPSYNVQTACSTSLVAVHQACQSLIAGECEMALAGGVCISLPKREGYFYQDGMIFARDGHCRPFDEDSSGTVPGNGYGLVVLKRLDDAVASNDTIYAVIKGSAVNNDGLRKVGYTAPSIDGQADVIGEALRVANVSPESMTFVEAHGTGTSLGDPIEIEALKKAYRTTKTGYCFLGSVKANIGHLDTAAGIAGLIKAALSLHHKTIPPAINFSKFNRRIGSGESPFVVTTTAVDCRDSVLPLRAGVSSFGIGGTNAHVVLEEAPPMGESGPERAQELLVFSARTQRSVAATSRRVVAYLAAHPEVKLSDAAYTLQVGRQAFDYRQAVVVDRARLRAGDGEVLAEATSGQAVVGRPVYLLLPGQGTQYQGMGRGLYDEVRRYREEVDAALAWLPAADRAAIWAVLYGAAAPDAIHDTQYSQVTLFVVEYALARYVMDLGIRPQGLVGHSLGELVAATLAGVFELRDAVRLVWLRGQIMQAQPRGAMLAVAASEAAVRPTLIAGVDVAVVNTTQGCVVSGETACVEAYAEQLRAQGVECRRVATSHAFHSPLMAAATAAFTAEVAQVRCGPVGIPFISNVTGTWIGAEASTAAYWGNQLRQPVQFAQGLATVLQTKDALLLEVGPGQTLSTFAQQHRDRQPTHRVVYLLRHHKEPRADAPYLADKLGRVWCEGVALDWPALHDGQPRHRVPLPTYDFEQQVFADDVRGTALASAPKAETAVAVDGAPASSVNDGVESRLAALWTEVLGVERIGPDDDFFQLGGHSLSAVSLVSLIQRELGVDVALTEVFNRSTVRELASYLTRREVHRPQTIPAVAAAASYSASSAQRRMFAMSTMTGHSTAYNLPDAYLIEGDLDVTRVHSVVDQLVARHESFRTTFGLVNGEVVQSVGRDIGDVFEYQEAFDGSVEAALASFVRPFDLSNGPLIRFGLTRLSTHRYLFMVDMPHIISDHSSMGILASEFSKLYAGMPLDALAIQYKDYSAWHNAYLQSASANRQVQYWLDEFQGEIPVLNLPTDFSRPKVRRSEGASVTFRCGLPLSGRVRTFANENGLTPYMVMLGAVNLVLWLNSGQDDIVVGTPVAGRRHAELDAVVGMFVNTLAIRVAVDADVSVREFFRRVKEKLLNSYENQDCSFETLVERLNPPKDLSRNPLFDVVVNYLNRGNGEFAVPGLSVTPQAVQSSRALYELTWIIYEQGEEFVADLEYSTQLFKADSIERLKNQLLMILDAVSAHPETLLRELEFVTPEEKQQLLREDNDTRSDFPRHETLVGLFEEQAARSASVTAVTFGDDSLTYRELNRAANQIAWTLKERGVRPRDMVGLVAEPSLGQVVATLGILKAGAAYVPLEPDGPKSRICSILDDCGATVVVTQKCCSTLLHDRGGLVLLDEPAALDARTDNPPRVSSADDVAYVMYTSGSTGQPKGTLINHRNVTRVVVNTNYVSIGEDDVFLQLSTHAFDGAIFGLFGALLNGAGLVILPKEDTIDVVALRRAIEQHRISMFFITAALFNVIVDVDVEMLKPVRTILVGGDRVSTSHARRALRVLGPGHLVNGYGPTESTVFATSFAIDAVDRDATSVPIGKPISNTTVYVLDRYNRVMPTGVAGELCLGGDGVGGGYLNRPELTREKFVDNPFEPGTKMYRTGDLVRRLPDGTLDCLGRMDAQVKIRGFRVELGEIEDCISRIEGVTEAVVMAKEHADRGTHLIAFFTAEREARAPDVRRILKDSLPDYMIPEQVMQLDRFPLNANGKVDRRALARIEATDVDAKAGEPPRDDLERRLCEAMQEVLSVASVGPNDDFFDLGGHSLKAISLVHRLSQQQLALRVNDVFQCRTVRNMADLPSLRGRSVSVGRVTDSLQLEQLVFATVGATARVIVSEPTNDRVLVVNSEVIAPELRTAIAEHVDPALYPAYVIADPTLFARVENQSRARLGGKGGLIRFWAPSARATARLIAGLERQQGDLTARILAAGAPRRVELSAVQIGHLALGSFATGLVYEVPHRFDVQAVNETITEIINRNQLLRCVLSEDGPERCWQEHGEITAGAVPVIDLTRYHPRDHTTMLTALARHLFDAPYTSGAPLHRPVCIQLNWHKCVVLWGMDHTVFDGMSAEIIKRQFETIYSFRLAGQPADLGAAQPYEDYVLQLKRGPVDTSEEDIVATHRLRSFRTALNECLVALRHKLPQDAEFTITVPLSDIPAKEVWTHAFELSHRWLREQTGLSEIPMSILNLGRQYAGRDYFDCVGECLDILPALTTGSPNEIRALIDYSSRHNINFLALAVDPELRRRYPIVAECLGAAPDHHQPLELILYNFQGRVSKTEASLLGNGGVDRKLAALTITAYYDDEHLHVGMSAACGIERATGVGA